MRAPNRTPVREPSSSGGSTPVSSGGAPLVSGGGFQPLGSGGGNSATSAPYLVTGNSSGPSLGTFPYFALYVLDYNQGQVIFPNTTKYGTPGGKVDLRAQVSGTTVSSISWNTAGLTHATSISGSGTYNLTFQWNSSIFSPATDTASVTVTNTLGQAETETFTFSLPFGTHAGGTGTATWPASLSPDTVLASDPMLPTNANASVDSNSGALDADITLPTYNPNLSAIALTYDSITADPRPIVVLPHQIDPTNSTVPTQVSALLTFNGTTGTTWYYDTSSYIPGDIQQIALQANATGLSTGRYAYSATVADIRGGNTTFTLSGNSDVLNYSSNAIGDGWTVQGLEQITPASGGVIVDLGDGGKSLWFSGSPGSGGGSYSSPAGEFSTLTLNGDGTYTRTFTSGDKINFNSSGQQIATVNDNGLRVTFAYSGGNIQTITDPYGNITTFAYSGGALQTIIDPASRIATFTHSGGNLSGVTMPDGSTWGYTYDSGGRLTQITDQRSNTTSITYDSAERVSTVTLPDSNTQKFTAYRGPTQGHALRGKEPQARATSISSETVGDKKFVLDVSAYGRYRAAIARLTPGSCADDHGTCSPR